MIRCAVGRCAHRAAVLVDGGTLAVPACTEHGESAGKDSGATVREMPSRRPRLARRRTGAVLAFPGAVPATR